MMFNMTSVHFSQSWRALFRFSLYFIEYSVLPKNTRWHLVSPTFRGVFSPAHFLTRLCFQTTVFGFEFAPHFHPDIMASSLHCALPACLPACLLGLSMNLPCCDVYLFPGGHSLCEQVDRTWSASSAFPRHTYPVEQDALVTPNRSGSLPTAHIWVLRMAWQKMSSQFFFFFFLSEVD